MVKVVKDGEALFDKFPHLKSEWDFVKNTLDPNKLHPGTLKKAYWKCSFNHSYEKAIRSKTVLGTTCPECNSFGHNYPELSETWHTKNKMKPNQVSQGSNLKVYWHCDNGHTWKSTVASRRKHNCPYCMNKKASPEDNFLLNNPQKAKYWDYNKNSLDPENFRTQSNKKCWFLCQENHSFDSTLTNIFYGKWCPYCSGKKVGYGNSLNDTNPKVAAEWHPKKNKFSPKEVTSGSNKKVWWICSSGHEWKATIHSRSVKGYGCPYCSGHYAGYGNTLSAKHPELVKEIDFMKSKINPDEIHPGTELALWWKCERGHSWKTSVKHRTQENGTGCPFCTSQTSSPEIRLFCELKSIFPDTKNREKIQKTEVDVYIPSLKIAVEYDGAYYHKDKHTHDEQKIKTLNKAGLKVFRLREKPLLINDDDVQVLPRNSAPKKSEINELLYKVCTFNPEFKKVCEKYINQKGFSNENEYRRILSYLPGPPKEDSLLELFPEISSEWNFNKNSPLKPEMFHPHSGKKMWWVCSLGHEYQATIDKRTLYNRGCSYCSNKKVGYGNSLHDKFPAIAAEWFQPGNGTLTPKDVTSGGGNYVWWECKNGHKFQSRVADRTSRNSGCLYCPGAGKNRKYTPTEFD